MLTIHSPIHNPYELVLPQASFLKQAQAFLDASKHTSNNTAEQQELERIQAQTQPSTTAYFRYLFKQAFQEGVAWAQHPDTEKKIWISACRRKRQEALRESGLLLVKLLFYAPNGDLLFEMAEL